MEEKTKQLFAACTNICALIEKKYGKIKDDEDYAECIEIIQWIESINENNLRLPIWVDIIYLAIEEYESFGPQPNKSNVIKFDRKKK